MSNLDAARAIQTLRAEARLTQQELADLVGTTASSISRLEDARYEGHTVTMLRRIAAVLNKSVEIRFVPTPPSEPQKAEPSVTTWRQTPQLEGHDNGESEA